jgi:hypothetical protein
MLLQIDVYPNNEEAPSRTFHLSPATAAHRKESDEKWLTLGRKDCDVLLEKEKAVSRQHAVLRCLSLESREGCGKATTEEEVQACEENPLGMCLVLENLGKGGSCVIMADLAATTAEEKKADSKNNKDDEATDDETDDEGISQPVSQALSTVIGGYDNMALSAQKFFGKSAPLSISKLEVGEKKVLSFTDDNRVIFCQFAISPSRPAIRITWHPLNLVCSSTVPAAIKSKLYLGGAVVAEGFPDKKTTTHLVAKEYSPVAKQLIAWCLGIPIVSPDFCQAHIKRQDMNDTLPDPSHFSPSMPQKFWKQTPNAHLLSQFVILSLVPNMEDTELLAEAAGATVLRLYENTFSDDDNAFDHVQSLVKEQQRQKSQKIMAIFAVPANKKGNKAKLPLFHRITEDLEIPSTNIKEIARAITDQSSALQDTHRKVIPGAEQQDDVTSEPEKEKPIQNDNEDDCDSDHTEVNEGEVGKETEVESPKRRLAEKQEAHQSENISTSSLPPKQSVRARTSASSHTVQLDCANANGWFVVAPKDDSKRSEFRKKASQALVKDGGVGLEPAASTKRVVQVVTPMDTSSSQSNRNAPRMHVDGLVFGRLPRPNTGGPNFKRFRKNFTAPVDPEDVVVLVDFVSEKTQKQRDMDEQAKKLEEQQREADALFRGAGIGVAPKKRRRKD